MTIIKITNRGNVISNQAILYDQVSRGQYQCGVELIGQLALIPGETVIDIGCGTGQLTALLADAVGEHGCVHAIEPDRERCQLAQQRVTAPQIHWFADRFDHYQPPQMPFFNAAYSNYVFHWMSEQSSALQRVADILMPGGRFAFCCVHGMPEVIRYLCHTLGAAGDAIIASLHFTTQQQWLDYFKQSGFRIVQIDEVPDYQFNSIDDVMSWWQATTHGKFSVEQLSSEQLADIHARYTSQVAIYRKETLRLIAEKK